MNIALTASDKKKELMVQFCIAYGGILQKHNVCATATTGKLISDITGIEVFRFLRGSAGGSEPMKQLSEESEEWTLLRLCDIHNIPVATNIATAEILIQAIDRGDLDWREGYDRSKQLF